MNVSRDHLPRLEDPCYCGTAVVQWTMTIRDRQTGWLDETFYCQFRELLAHSQFRYAIACPIFCLMPDHMHLIWMGIDAASDQKLAMRRLRTRCNTALNDRGFELQDQPYDHVLRDDERQEDALHGACEYIARNPERAGLIEVDAYASYPYSGCLVPGYPELKPFVSDFWARFHRSVSWLRANGLVHH